MDRTKANTVIKLFLQEILLYSGQFALFYLLMQFLIDGTASFSNPGHMSLLITLIVQTALLSLYGDRIVPRLLLSFIIPLVYSLIELQEGAPDLLNAAHLGFWFYALVSGVLVVMKMHGGTGTSRISEMVLVLVNVFIFVFLYFYFDSWKELEGDMDELTITRIYTHTSLFLSDLTHWFIIFGGGFLALTVALGRNEIALLKEKIYALFGKYVDSNIRDLIISEGKVQSRRQNLCILFSDIKSFTTLCENHDPQEITGMLNLYFEQWNTLVVRHKGTVDKYIGDAIMVIFGLSGEEHACDDAVSCGREMERQWPALTDELIRRGLPVPEGFGIGCHFGELILGDIGSSERKNFTVIGDTVNIASRLEAASRRVDSTLLASSAVYSRLSPDNRESFTRIGRIKLKGKSEGIETWGLRGISGETPGEQSL